MLLPYTTLTYYGAGAAAMYPEASSGYGELYLAEPHQLMSISIDSTSTGTAQLLRPYRGYTAAITAQGTASIVVTPHQSMKANLLINVGAVPSASDIAQAILNAQSSLYNNTGTIGAKINAAGGAADPWGTSLPGSYVEGEAGYILGSYLDKKVSDVAVVATGAALNVRASGFVLTTGTEASGDYLSTYDLNEVYHKIDPVGNDIDCYYEFTICEDCAPVSTTIVGRMAGRTNVAEVWAWHWADSAWRQIGSFAGRVSDITASFNLFIAHVGTGVDLGKVRIRLSDIGATNSLYVDQLWVSYTAFSAFSSSDRATLNSIPDSVIDINVDGTTTLAESIRLQNAVLLGKVSGAGTGVESFRDIADSKDRVVSTVDSVGNRTSVVLDGS